MPLSLHINLTVGISSTHCSVRSFAQPDALRWPPLLRHFHPLAQTSVPHPKPRRPLPLLAVLRPRTLPADLPPHIVPRRQLPQALIHPPLPLPPHRQGWKNNYSL